MSVAESLNVDTVIDVIESIHAMHGTASLGSMSLEQNFIYASRGTVSSSTPALSETGRSRRNSAREFPTSSQSSSALPLGPAALATSSSRPSLRSSTVSQNGAAAASQMSPISWFTASSPNSGPQSDLLSLATESIAFLITPDGEPIDMASPKRNRDMHELFPELDEDELLIEDYSCAWQKDMLLQGRLFITTQRLAFNAKIIWSYSVTIPYDDIVSVTKKSVAGIFPNAIEVVAKSGKASQYFFASFLTRDATLDLVTRVWIGFPNNAVQLKSPDRPDFDDGVDREMQPPSRRASHTAARSHAGTGGLPGTRRASAAYASASASASASSASSPAVRGSHSHALAQAGHEVISASALHNSAGISPAHSFPSSPVTLQRIALSAPSPKWAAHASPTAEGRQALPHPQAPGSPMYMLDHNISSGSLMLTKSSVGLAELAAMETANSPGGVSAIDGVESSGIFDAAAAAAAAAASQAGGGAGASSLGTNGLAADIAGQARSHIVHQRHPVSLTKPDTPKLRRPAPPRTAVGVSIGSGILITGEHSASAVAPGSSAQAQAAPRLRGGEGAAAHAESEALSQGPPRKLTRPPSVVLDRPVECPCDELHSRMKPLLDANVPLPIEILWALVYGHESASKGFLRNFWDTQLKHKDTSGSEWVPESAEIPDPAGFEAKEHDIPLSDIKPGYHRRISYVVPLTNPLGPKETRCLIHDHIVNKQDGYICVRQINQTPDVPSGTCFDAITRVCLSFVSKNITRMRVSCDIEYTKTTWIKMAIDRAVPEGLKAYQTSLLTALRLHISSTPTLIDDLARSLNLSYSDLGHAGAVDMVNKPQIETIAADDAAAATFDSHSDL
ncbi:hypothetical protein HK105_209249 [Polyrhizophydium stewartii]|uniref:VASt domain-containing protein n=1 Tax=Polyrhizophydium stewartii TaxID=2732419 RepID=A0ABR4MVK0_9FUNG